ncbi:hypothetical protein ACF1B0_35585 [Streptomyces anandii]|uniref:hypothetical protein n=1 Tax=Streptomyces anandii TaxID=285454 RepID=UPI0036F52257
MLRVRARRYASCVVLTMVLSCLSVSPSLAGPPPAAAPLARATTAPLGADTATKAPWLTYFGPYPKVEVGGQVNFNVWNVPPETDKVVVTSPALVEPIELAPAGKATGLFVQVDDHPAPRAIRDGISPGTYPVTATVHGRPIATAQLVVARREQTSVSKFVIYPKGAPPCSNTPTWVRPGSGAYVLLSVRSREEDEDQVTVTSPAFQHSVTLNKGEGPGCLGDDGAVVYQGQATVRDDLPSGEYEMTVTGRFAPHSVAQQVTVAGKAAPHNHWSWLVPGACAAGVALLVILVITGRRTRRRAVHPS